MRKKSEATNKNLLEPEDCYTASFSLNGKKDKRMRGG